MNLEGKDAQEADSVQPIGFGALRASGDQDAGRLDNVVGEPPDQLLKQSSRFGPSDAALSASANSHHCSSNDGIDGSLVHRPGVTKGIQKSEDNGVAGER